MGSTKDAIELAKLLSQTLGIEKAQEEVGRAVDRRKYNHVALTQEQALEVLELLTKEPGIVGIAARFAKGRVHLVWNQSSTAPTRKRINRTG